MAYFANVTPQSMFAAVNQTNKEKDKFRFFFPLKTTKCDTTQLNSISMQWHSKSVEMSMNFTIESIKSHEQHNQ